MTPTDLRSTAQAMKFMCDNSVVLRMTLADLSAISSLGLRATQEADAIEAKAVESAKEKSNA